MVFRAEERSPLQIARQHWQAERVLQDSGSGHQCSRIFMQNLFGMVRDGTVAAAAKTGGSR